MWQLRMSPASPPPSPQLDAGGGAYIPGEGTIITPTPQACLHLPHLQNGVITGPTPQGWHPHSEVTC